MEERLCLATAHAHPDDESSKGAGTVAIYKAAGVRTVYPIEDYVLARTLVPVPEGGVEDDLFAGCRPVLR